MAHWLMETASQPARHNSIQGKIISISLARAF